MTPIRSLVVSLVQYVPGQDGVLVNVTRRLVDGLDTFDQPFENVTTTQTALQARAVVNGVPAWGDQEVADLVLAQQVVDVPAVPEVRDAAGVITKAAVAAIMKPKFVGYAITKTV